jgi:hypothetical protein
MDFWPKILQVLQQSNDSNDKTEVDCHHVDFSNGCLWPDAIDLDPFCNLDNDRWNLYHADDDDAQHGVDDWYSFVENTTPPDTTIASIIRFYDANDEGRQEAELPRGSPHFDMPPCPRQITPPGCHHQQHNLSTQMQH